MSIPFIGQYRGVGGLKQADSPSLAAARKTRSRNRTHRPRLRRARVGTLERRRVTNTHQPARLSKRNYGAKAMINTSQHAIRAICRPLETFFPPCRGEAQTEFG